MNDITNRRAVGTFL